VSWHPKMTRRGRFRTQGKLRLPAADNHVPWHGGKQPSSVFSGSFHISTACFRQTAPPNVGMAWISRHTTGL